MSNRRNRWVGVFAGLSLMMVGCSAVSDEQPRSWDEESLGQGIVEGTKGYRSLSHEAETRPVGESVVTGQVVQIEGGAYVIKTVEGVAYRVPHDQDTRIDRPAHVGDWIQVHFDQRGRGRTIEHVELP